MSSLNVDAMLRAISDNLKKGSIHTYKPHAKQILFHSANTHGRLFLAGNRAGKSVAGVVEDIWYCTGNHPYRKVPEIPVRGRVVAVDFKEGLDQIILPLFKQWLNPGSLVNGSWEDSFAKAARVLTFSNGSTIEFMSYEQEQEKFAGTSRHFIHYDEEPPKPIYEECGARLVDTNGDWWITMTPVNGMTWVYEELFTGARKDLIVVEASIYDNPHLSPEAIDRYLDPFDEETRRAREKGEFFAQGGLVFKKFNPSVHVVPPIVPPIDWPWYRSLDQGFNNPTAWLWHAVDPKNNHVITFGEHYAAEQVIEQHATTVHLRDALFGKVPELSVGDPAIAQRSAVSGLSIQTEYINYGLPVILAPVRDVATGVLRMSQYLRTNAWTITEDCPNLIRELRHLRWEVWAERKARYDKNPKETIHKKNDHAADSARYFFTLLPDMVLSGASPQEKPKKRRPAHRSRFGSYDQLLMESTPWEVVEANPFYEAS